MKVPLSFFSYNHLKMTIFQEQQVNSLAYSGAVARCVWCGEVGGIDTVYTRPYPGKPIVPLVDLHHWYFKRGTALPDEILNSPENVVVLHRHCHMRYGQAKEMTDRCREWKEGLCVGYGQYKQAKYNLSAWIEDVKVR